MASFIKDVEEIRQRAVDKIEDGPVTATYRGDKDKAISILNEALATEIVCVLRYMHHYFMATGVHGRAVAGEFKEHADAEREHADEIAERIQQLGGKPDYNPASLLQRSISQYVEGETLADMIREDLIAERMVIEVYQEMIRYFGNNDPTTRTMIEHILSEEEEHAADLSDLLFVVNPHTGEAEGRDPGTNPLGIERSRQSRQGFNSEQQGSSQGVRRSQLNDRGERSPNPQEDVRGRDREYDGVQQMNAQSRNQQQSRTQERSGSANADRQESNTESRRSTTGTPGASGRPMNRRKDIEEEDVDEVAERPDRGGMSGGTRSPKVLQKKRKEKRVA
jgi:bacterioferritin